MNSFLKVTLAISLALIAGNAWAVDDATQKTITDAIHQLVPQAQIESIDKAPLAGMYVVVASGQVVYVSADGKYLMQGDLYNLASRTNLTASRMDKVRKAAIAAIEPDQIVRFAPDDPKYHVTVFTDIDCGYCRKLHSHIKDINKEGIAVDYLFFPRTGIGSHSYDKAVTVWCADDRRKALTEAKAGQSMELATCKNPVAKDYKLGQRLGVTGTPTIIADDGSVIGGYMNPQQLLQRVRAVAASTQDKVAKGG